MNCHETETMCSTECLTLCYFLCSTPYDSLSNSISPRDSVEYQVLASYSGYPAGWLTLLKTDQRYWFPLNLWLEQSGFAYFHPLNNQSFHRLRLRNPVDHRIGQFQIGGYSPLQSKPWKIYHRFQNISMKSNPLKEYFFDHRQTIWVSNHWIALQYGMATKFNEPALELDFSGKVEAPVKEWNDYHARWLKINAIKSPTLLKDSMDIHRPKTESKSIEISTWSGRYEIHFQSGKFNSNIQWDAVGHLGKIGFRAFGTANAILERSTNIPNYEPRNALTTRNTKIEWPSLELEWAWGSQQQINLIISPASVSSFWKITGGNTLMSRTIGFEAPKGIHTRRWKPPTAMSEWSFNHGPFMNHPHFPMTTSPNASKDRLDETKDLVPVALLPGSNQIDYRYKNAWGGISNRSLLWNIPGLMIPEGRWNYRYEFSAPLRISGIVGYGLRPSLSLQSEAIVQPAKDTGRNLEWDVKGSAIWTAGRILYGQSQYTVGHDNQKWEQRLHFYFSQSLQSSLHYQSYTYSFDPKPIGEFLNLSGLWILPKGYGLKMLRLEYPLMKLIRPQLRHELYQAILQFEGWGQQWLWQIPEHRLSWQGRIQLKAPSLTLVYQAIAHQEGWQAFVQGHLRGGHHLGVSYSLNRQNTSNRLPTTQPKAGNWALEWKWVGLQSSRSVRALLNRESSRLEYHGQFTLSRNNNTLPISATNGLALILLDFYGDQNANGTKDPDENTLDAYGAFDLPAGIPYQLLVNGSALLGPFPNYNHVRIRLTPHHMRSPGWISDHLTMELHSIPNSTIKYQIALLRGRQIFGTLTLGKIPASTMSNSLSTNPGGIRIYVQRWDEGPLLESCLSDSTSSPVSHSCKQALTLSDGYFEFNDLRPGLYKVWVDCSTLRRLGYSGHCSPQILDLHQEESVEVNFNSPLTLDIP